MGAIQEEKTAYVKDRTINRKHYAEQREIEYQKQKNRRKQKALERREAENSGYSRPAYSDSENLEERLAERRPWYKFTGFFTGNSQWATKEMGRLTFCEEYCKKCKDSGFVQCARGNADGDCTREG